MRRLALITLATLACTYPAFGWDSFTKSAQRVPDPTEIYRMTRNPTTVLKPREIIRVSSTLPGLTDIGANYSPAPTWAGSGTTETSWLYGPSHDFGARKLSTATNATTSYTFTTAVDWSDASAYRFLEVLINVEDATKVGILQFYAFGPDASNMKAAQIYPTTESGMWKGKHHINTGWNLLYFKQEDFRDATAGAIAWNTLRGFQFYVTATGGTANVWVFPVRIVKPRGVIILSHDDGYDDLEAAWAIEEEFGFRSAAYCITGSIGSAGFITWAKLEAAYRRGHDICNHTASHPTTSAKTQTEMQTEWATAKLVLDGHGFSESSGFCAAPGNARTTTDAGPVSNPDGARLACIAAGGTSLRWAGVAGEAGWPAWNSQDAFYQQVRYNSLSSAATIATVKGWIDDIDTYGGSLELTTHHVAPGAVGATTIPPGYYQDVCAYLASKTNIDVMTLSEWRARCTPAWVLYSRRNF